MVQNPSLLSLDGFPHDAPDSNNIHSEHRSSTYSIKIDSWSFPARTMKGPRSHPSLLFHSKPIISCLLLIFASCFCGLLISAIMSLISMSFPSSSSPLPSSLSSPSPTSTAASTAYVTFFLVSSCSLIAVVLRHLRGPFSGA